MLSKRVGMPGNERLSPMAFAEYLVDSRQPVVIRASQVAAAGLSPDDVGRCNAIGSFAAAPGRADEIVFRAGGPGGCTLALSEVTADASHQALRTPAPFIDGPKNCTLGN